MIFCKDAKVEANEEIHRSKKARVERATQELLVLHNAEAQVDTSGRPTVHGHIFNRRGSIAIENDGSRLFEDASPKM